MNFNSPGRLITVIISIFLLTKLKQIFKNIEVQNKLIFSSIFHKSISQKVLLYFFDQIESDYSLLVYKPKTSKDFLTDLKIANPNIKLRKLLQMFGLKTAIEEMGIREFREITKLFGNNTWYRIKKDYSLLKFPSNKSSKIEFIKEALLDFQPLKLSNSFNKEL